MRALHHLLLVVACASITFATTSEVIAQPATTEPPGRVWGYIFGDYFIKANGDDVTWGAGQYADVERGMHAGELRRFYLGYDYRFSPRFSSRVLLEANDGSTFANGSYGVFVKLGFLSWHNTEVAMPFTMNIGLIPTPIFAFPERTWGYRSVEKEALNQRGFGRAVDQGISMVGTFSQRGTTGYHLMVGNNSGTRPAANPYKAFYGSLYQRFPAQNLNFEVMGSYMPVGRGDGATRIGRAFVSFEPGVARFGAEVAGVWDQNARDLGLPLGDETVRLLTSTFAAIQILGGGIPVEMFGRYDFYNPDLDYDAAKPYTSPEAHFVQHLFIGGFDIKPHPRVHIIPNLWVNLYQAREGSGLSRDPDVVPRLTFYFVY